MTLLARDYDIRYGHGLALAESANWPRYVAVSTPTAWKTAQPFLAQQPAGVIFNEWLDSTHLEETADSLPDDAELVVGVGSGRALDHAKVVAARKNIPLIQLPTVVSTGAIIHTFCGNWTGRIMDGFLAEVAAEHVLIDYDLVLAGPERLNTAGIGDVLCGYAGMSEWRYSAARGLTDPFDDELADPVIAFHRQIVQDFPATLGANQELTPASVKFIMQAVQGRDDHMLKHPAAPGADHSFCFSVEWASDKFWIHGETCALAAVIVAWHTQQDPDEIIRRLDTCKVRFRPADIEMTKEELRKGLEALPEWMSRGNSDSIMQREPVTGDKFEECWNWLQTI